MTDSTSRLSNSPTAAMYSAATGWSRYWTTCVNRRATIQAIPIGALSRSCSCTDGSTMTAPDDHNVVSFREILGEIPYISG